MAQNDEQELSIISELEEAERLVDTLGSTLEALITGYGTGLLADSRQTSDVLELILNHVRGIGDKLDDLGQCVVQDKMEIRPLKGLAV